MEPELAKRKCVPCEGNTPPLTSEKVQELLQQVKGWNTIDNKKIEKNVSFKDFRSALGFVNEVGDLAEYEGHHPDLYLHNWNKLTITLKTHAIKGLSENDFIMAAKINNLLIENADLH